MAIRGRYTQGNPPAPFVEARVYLLSQRLAFDLDFLIDTGADATMLSPGDVLKFGIDVDALRGQQRSYTGIGGSMQMVEEDARITFYDEGADEWQDVFITLLVAAAENAGPLTRLPSILGRNILNDYLCTLDARQGSVTLEPY